jgi:hypothetical protein
VTTPLLRRLRRVRWAVRLTLAVKPIGVIAGTPQADKMISYLANYAEHRIMSAAALDWLRDNGLSRTRSA